MTSEYRHGDRHVYRHVAGEHLLIAIHRDTVAPMFAFTPTAAALWRLLDAWSTEDALVGRLLERFDVTPERAAADVAEFLEQLRSIGALEQREMEMSR
jgi:hypothetical protein